LPRITRAHELDRFGFPKPAVRDKALDSLRSVHVEWIRSSPLVLVATSSRSGSCDVSPKGDPPGFVQVLDAFTVAVPERMGNLRMDGFRNVIDNPHAGLLLLIPGRPETLRVNGSASLVTDGPFFDAMKVRGSRPELALLVSVEEVFFHCPRAFARARLWQPDNWQPHAVRPYSDIAHALWRAEATLAEVRQHYSTPLQDADLYPASGIDESS
jgi:PPOX class probable FMN-dependent enzyme